MAKGIERDYTSDGPYEAIPLLGVAYAAYEEEVVSCYVGLCDGSCGGYGCVLKVSYDDLDDAKRWLRERSRD